MKRRKLIFAICITLIVILIGVLVTLFLLELADDNWNLRPANLVRSGIILIGLILSLVKLISGIDAGSRPLSFYEASYQKELGSAFSEPKRKASRKTLLKAIAFYNENRFMPAISKLNALKKKCESRDDFVPFCFFWR